MSKLSYPANKPYVAGYYGVLYNNPEKDGQEYPNVCGGTHIISCGIFLARTNMSLCFS